MRRVGLLLAMSLMPAWVAALTWPDRHRVAEHAGRPRLLLKVDQHVGMAPTLVALTADLVGGADDDKEFYCPTLEWDWDDETESESTFDCRPYRPGVSAMVRHFAVEHVFKEAGEYHVTLRLTRHETELAFAETNIFIK
jgi:hypothetical protein